MKENEKKFSLKDFVKKNTSSILSRENLKNIDGGYNTKGRRQSWNVEDCRGDGYWLYCVKLGK